MILIRRLTNDPEYSYIANIYPGMSTFDYLIRQLSVWMDSSYQSFNVELDTEVTIIVNNNETVPKSLREKIVIKSHNNAIAKSLKIPCIMLQSPSPEPDETGAVTLWYDLIDLDSKRAERSLMRILDKYMYKDSDPYNSASSTTRSKKRTTTKKASNNGRQHKRKTRRS